MAALLTEIGTRVRTRRQARGLTIKALAERSGVSIRFLIELEKGRGNISVSRLAAVADALGEPLASFFVDAALVGILGQLRHLDTSGLAAVERIVSGMKGAPRRRFATLLGVRGAGKSTVGRRVAEALSVDFVELDARIEALAGLSLSEIFAIHGEPYYRRIEYEALTALVSEGREAIVATGGSIVAHDESWRLLRDHSQTLWLRADAQEHWDRVIAQGDHRPMDRNPQAFAQLEALLKQREPLYAQAEYMVDTSGKSLDGVVAEVITALERA